MPTIKRPQTYAEILQALEAAKAKADVTAPADLAFSATTLTRLNTFLPTYRTEMQEMGSALSAQTAASNVVNAAQPKMKMFISHYFQVFNFGIEREVYAASDRAHYMLDVDEPEVPPMRTEQEIAMWGARIISGDAARVAAGGAAMANPSAAQVGTQHAIFVAAQGVQSTKKTAYDHEQEDVATISEDALDLVDDIWDECEFTFRKDTPPSKRRKCREYGVVYVPRAGETPSPDDFSMMGTITDSVTGLPIGGAAVVVATVPEIIVLTDANGKYFVPVLTPASYNVFVHKGGYVEQTIGVVVTAGSITTHNFQLVAGETGTVAGNVTAAGVPAAANIIVESMAGGVSTDPMGNYTRDNVPVGPQVVKCALASDPTNFQTQNIIVVEGGTVVVNFVFP